MKIVNIILILIVISVFGCKKGEQDTFSTSNANFKIDFLFEHNGCRVYRFLDDCDYVYFSDCSGRFEHETTHHNGKTTYNEKHQTIGF
jgi:hypothetical protein